MHKLQILFALAIAGTLGAGCGNHGAAAGDIAVTPDLASTAVLYTRNLSNDALELRVVTGGQSRFIGSIGPGEANTIALDPTLLPAGELYVLGIAPDGRRRAVGGPLAVGKGNAIRFTVEPTLSMSRAVVVSK
jgi:hypothetical protein